MFGKIWRKTCLCTNVIVGIHIVQIALCFHRKIWCYQKKTLLDIRLPIFFRVQNPENIQNGNGNRHTVQAVQERMQNGHGSGLSERMRNGNGNRGPSESEVVMVNGLRNAQKSPVASTSQGKYLLCFLVKFWFSDFTFIPFYFFTNFRHLQIILFIFYISRFRTPTFHFKPKFKAFKWK